MPLIDFEFQVFSTNSGSGGSILGVSAEAHKWTHLLFDWATLGNLTQVGKIEIRLNQTQNESLYFDEILIFKPRSSEMITSN